MNEFDALPVEEQKQRMFAVARAALPRWNLGDAELALQVADELVDDARRDGVEPRGRLVVEDDLGIAHERAGQPGGIDRSRSSVPFNENASERLTISG